VAYVDQVKVDTPGALMADVKSGYGYLIDRMVAAMQAGNLEGILAQLHPRIVVREATSLPYGGNWTGHEGFTGLVTTIMGLASMQIVDHTVHETSDGMVAHMTLSFTSNATGAVLASEVVELYQVNDDLISDIDVYYKDVHALVEFFAGT
jgi:hypothetical protein